MVGKTTAKRVKEQASYKLLGILVKMFDDYDNGVSLDTILPKLPNINKQSFLEYHKRAEAFREGYDDGEVCLLQKDVHLSLRVWIQL